MKTKKQIAIIAVSWTLVAVCMVIIFMFSAQNGEGSQALSDNFTIFLGLPVEVVGFIRKTAHFFEFAGLAVLFYNAFYRTCGAYKPMFSFALTAVYAASDEFHQLFVEDRACRLFDFFVDCCGAATGIAVLALLIMIYNKFQSRRGLL